MRYLLRAFFTGSSALGLAMVVGCGAASDQATSYDASGEFHVPRSISSAEPRRLASDDQLAMAIAYADECSRVSDAELNVSPVAAREALPHSVFVVQPAQPISEYSQPAPATPVAKLILPPTDRGFATELPDVEEAPAPHDTVGIWTPPPATGQPAEQGTPVMRIPPAPRDWALEQRLADARGRSAPLAPPTPPAHRAPVTAAAPLVVPAPEQQVDAPQSLLPSEIPYDAFPDPVAVPTAPPTAAHTVEQEHVSPIDAPLAEPTLDQVPQLSDPPLMPANVPDFIGQENVEEPVLVPSRPIDEPAPAAEETPFDQDDLAPRNPILLTPESDGPDSHWPSTLVPLPPTEGIPEFAPEAPLPQQASAPVPAAPHVPVAPLASPPESPPPARPLASAPVARPIPGAAPQRTAEMEAVSRLAFARVQGGFSLAQRGALFAARSEFISTVRLLAQAKDTEQHTNRHSQALAAGLRALEEADSLFPNGSRVEADIDVEHAIAGHRTPVLHGVDASNMTVTVALQQYYTYAQEQLALAGDGEPVASMALYGLGKIHASLARQPSTNVKAPEPKAMVFHQAALLIDGRNFLAANDLGVLLVRLGRLPDAREAFQHSLSQQSQAQTWKNLSAVHRQLGEPQLADQALQRGELLARQGTKSSEAELAATEPNAVRWVDPSEFSGGASQTAKRPTPGEKERLKPIPESRETPVLERILPWTANKNTNDRK
ncbi:MAG: hypothetical protein KF708_07495 [Pirellulales bacterium]|nr:hypothetical protein [Pirellulales bacterium]